MYIAATYMVFATPLKSHLNQAHPSVDYLFKTTLAHRIQALADVGNKAERRSLKRAGFQLEGIPRGAGFLEAGGETGLFTPACEMIIRD
jgi:hypothetical protein